MTFLGVLLFAAAPVGALATAVARGRATTWVCQCAEATSPLRSPGDPAIAA